MKNLLGIITNLSTYPFTTSEYINLKKRISINHIEILSGKHIFELLMSFLRVSRYKNMEMKVILEQIPLFVDYLDRTERESLGQRNGMLYSLGDLVLSLLYENDPYITQALLAHFTGLVKIIELYLINLRRMRKKKTLVTQGDSQSTSGDESRTGKKKVPVEQRDTQSTSGDEKPQSCKYEPIDTHSDEYLDVTVFVDEHPVIYKAFCELFIALNLKNKELARNLRPVFQNIIMRHKILKKVYMSQRMYMEVPECLSLEDKQEIFLFFLYSQKTDNNLLLGTPYDPYLMQMRPSFLFFEQIFFYFLYFDCIPYLQNIALSKFREMIKNDSIFDFILNIKNDDLASTDFHGSPSDLSHCCKRLMLYNPSLKKAFFDKIERFNKTKKIELKNSHLLLRAMALNKKVLGQALGQRPPDSQKKDKKYSKLLEAFITTFDFHRLPLLVALRTFLNSFILPSESQQIERILEKFADRYYECQVAQPIRNQTRGNILSLDVINILTYMIIYLNTELHSPYAHGMSKLIFIERVRECIKDSILKKENTLKKSVKNEIAESINQNKIQDCEANTIIEQSDELIRNRILSTDQSITDKYLSSIYDDIKSNPFRPNNTFQYELETCRSFNQYMKEFGLEDVQLIAQEVDLVQPKTIKSPLETNKNGTTHSDLHTGDSLGADKSVLPQSDSSSVAPLETNKNGIKNSDNHHENAEGADKCVLPQSDSSSVAPLETNKNGIKNSDTHHENAEGGRESEHNETIENGSALNEERYLKTHSNVAQNENQPNYFDRNGFEHKSEYKNEKSNTTHGETNNPQSNINISDLNIEKRDKSSVEHVISYDIAQIYSEIAQDWDFTPVDRMKICSECKRDTIAILILRNIPQMFNKITHDGLENRLENIIALISYTESVSLLVTFLCWYKERMKIKREKIGCYMKIFYSILKTYTKTHGEHHLKGESASFRRCDEIFNQQLKKRIPFLIQDRNLRVQLCASISEIPSRALFFLSQPLRILNSYKKKSDAFFFKKTNEIEKMHIKLIRTISSESDLIFKYFVEVNYRFSIGSQDNRDMNSDQNGISQQKASFDTQPPHDGSEIMKFSGKILQDLQLIVKKNIVRIELIDPDVLVHILDSETFQTAISLKLSKIFLYLLKIYQTQNDSTEMLEDLIHENEEFFTEQENNTHSNTSQEETNICDHIRVLDLGEYLNRPKIFLSLCSYNDLFYILNKNCNLSEYLVRSKTRFENDHIIPNLQIIDKNAIKCFDKFIFILSVLDCMYKKTDHQIISPDRSLENITGLLQETGPKSTEDLLSMQTMTPTEQSTKEDTFATQKFLDNTKEPFNNVLRTIPMLIESLDAYETQSLQLIIKSLFYNYSHDQQIMKILMKIVFLTDSVYNTKLQNYMIQLWHSTGFSDPSIDCLLKNRKNEIEDQPDIKNKNQQTQTPANSKSYKDEQFEI